MFSSAGMRMVLDANLLATRSGLRTYLRIKSNDETSSVFVQLGFSISVTGSVADAGFQDVLVTPPADVRPVSMHNIGMSGGRLSFGAHRFLISHTFVLNLMRQRGFSDPYTVFRSPDVLGLFYESPPGAGRLFSIEDLTPSAVGADIVSWSILGNALERAVPIGR